MNRIRRATKIVATTGPASSDPETLNRMLVAGVDVVRLNFSHGTAVDHVRRADLVREAAYACGREVAIMADLQGPKIRVARFANGKIFLERGRKFILDPQFLDPQCEMGDQERSGLDHKELPGDVKTGHPAAP